EEVGLRGSRPSVTKFKPDLFFAVDCSPADDTVTKNGTFGHLGAGTLMRIYDPGMIMLPRMKEFLLDTAETNNIPYQYFVSKGGTDAGAAHMANEGIPSSVIGVPGRYIHTHQTLFSIADFEAAREMVIQVLKGLDRSTVDTILAGQ
ncbi:glutamyl aminopeptidase, partial [Listeria monocytogenes]|nr:glutamyl aminopeptidase [Listeria monocytogenes]